MLFTLCYSFTILPLSHVQDFVLNDLTCFHCRTTTCQPPWSPRAATMELRAATMKQKEDCDNFFCKPNPVQYFYFQFDGLLQSWCVCVCAGRSHSLALQVMTMPSPSRSPNPRPLYRLLQSPVGLVKGLQ